MIKDILTILLFLKERSPLEYGESLRNTATGVAADSSVNQAIEIGNAIIQKMIWEDAFEFSFRKKDQTVMVGCTTALRLDGELIVVDPTLLFRRLITNACHGLKNLLRKASKPQMADALR